MLAEASESQGFHDRTKDSATPLTSDLHVPNPVPNSPPLALNQATPAFNLNRSRLTVSIEKQSQEPRSRQSRGQRAPSENRKSQKGGVAKPRAAAGAASARLPVLGTRALPNFSSCRRGGPFQAACWIPLLSRSMPFISHSREEADLVRLGPGPSFLPVGSGLVLGKVGHIQKAMNDVCTMVLVPRLDAGCPLAPRRRLVEC